MRRQRQEEERRREEEVATCYSPASSSSRAAEEETTQAERLRLVAGMVRPAWPFRGISLPAALTYEDALVDGGTELPELLDL